MFKLIKKQRGSLGLEVALVISILALGVLSGLNVLGGNVNDKLELLASRLEDPKDGDVFANYPVEANRNSDGTYTLVWTAGNPAFPPYKVEYNVDNISVGWQEISDQDNNTGNVSAIITPVVGRNYYRVIDNQNNISAVKEIVGLNSSFLAADTTPPNKINGLAVGSPTSNTLMASWDAGTDSNGTIASYEIQYATSNTFLTDLISVKSSHIVTSINGLTPDTEYYFRVRAIDTTENKGPWSNSVSATTLPKGTTNTVLYIAEEGGTISGDTPQEVFFGGYTTAVTAVPDSGYVFIGWDDGHTDTSRVDTNIISSRNYTALFSPDELNFTVSYTAGGTVSPGSMVVPFGTTQTFVATPNLGYHVEKFILDGVNLGKINSYTLNQPNDDHTITVEFAINTYNITVNQKANGIISPSSITKDYGTNQTFTITPNSGYQVSDVIVDGQSVGTSLFYTFNNITAAHTIQAIFEGIPPTVTTQAASAILNSQANVSGTVVSNGTADISEVGFCWSTTAGSANTSGNKVSLAGINAGNFNNTIAGLTPGTTYYVKAYAINQHGTSYGNEISFITSPDAPVVVTQDNKVVGETTILLNGTVSLDSGSAITERGFVWGTIANPTTATNKITVAGTIGNYQGTISGLIPNSNYFVRAYATNAFRTSYGAEKQINTLTSLPSILNASAPSASSIALSWTAPTSGTVNYYRIYSGITLKYDNISGAGSSFAQVDTGLNPNTQYTYNLYSVNNSGIESTNKITTSKYTLALKPASATINQITGGTSLKINWTAPSSGTATQYKVYSSSNSYASPIYTGTLLTYTQTGLTPDTSYTYRIYSVNNENVISTEYTSIVGNTLPKTLIISPMATINGNIYSVSQPTLNTMSPIFNESFDRVNSTTVGNGWIQAISGTTNSTWGINTNSLYMSNLISGNNFGIYRDSTATNNRAVEFTMSATPSSLNVFVGRRNYSAVNGPSGYGYNVIITPSTARANIQKFNGSGNTNLVMLTNIPVAVGTKYRFEHTEAGLLTLKTSTNGGATWVTAGTVTDTTYMTASDINSYGVSIIITTSTTAGFQTGKVDDFIVESAGYSLPQGTNQTFNIVPNSGYEVENVIVDGVSVGPVSSYTFSDLQNNHTISATFVPNVSYIQFMWTGQGHSYMYVRNASTNALIDSKLMDGTVSQWTFQVPPGVNYKVTADWYDANYYDGESGEWGTGGVTETLTGVLARGQTYQFYY